MESSSIYRFVDKSIEELINPEFDFFYIDKSQIMDARFVDSSKPEKDEKLAWKPIPSIIDDNEIESLEKELKLMLPPSFKAYLKYKNFYELANLSDIWMFCPLIPFKWKEKILEQTFDGYPQEYLYDKGLLPIADYSDWGLTCFNTLKKDINGEYEIVMWDHELPDEFKPIATSLNDLFEQALTEFESLNNE